MVCVSVVDGMMVDSISGMLNGRENFGCAHFYSDAHFGRPVVLAAGDYSSGSEAEILDYTG